MSLYFLNKSVRRELVRRRKYSNGLIVDLFYNIFAYHKAQMALREREWQDNALALITSSVAMPTERQRANTIHPALTHFDTKVNLMVGADGKPVATANTHLNSPPSSLGPSPMPSPGPGTEMLNYYAPESQQSAAPTPAALAH